MHKPKLKRIFAILLIISCIFCLFPVSFASDDAFDFDKYKEVSGNQDANNIAQNTMGIAIITIRTVATGIAVIMLSYIGIKYLMAAPSEKADFKKSATIYIVGAILVFAAGNIIGIIVDYTTQNIS